MGRWGVLVILGRLSVEADHPIPASWSHGKDPPDARLVDGGQRWLRGGLLISLGITWVVQQEAATDQDRRRDDMCHAVQVANGQQDDCAGDGTTVGSNTHWDWAIGPSAAVRVDVVVRPAVTFRPRGGPGASAQIPAMSAKATNQRIGLVRVESTRLPGDLEAVTGTTGAEGCVSGPTTTVLGRVVIVSGSSGEPMRVGGTSPGAVAGRQTTELGRGAPRLQTRRGLFRLCVFIGLLSAARPSWADTTVTLTGNSATDTAALNSAIAAANASGTASTITIAGSGANTTLTLDASLTALNNPTHSIQIVGTNGAKIDGGSNFQIFTVSSGTVTIAQLQLNNGRVGGVLARPDRTASTLPPCPTDPEAAEALVKEARSMSRPAQASLCREWVWTAMPLGEAWEETVARPRIPHRPPPAVTAALAACRMPVSAPSAAAEPAVRGETPGLRAPWARRARLPALAAEEVAVPERQAAPATRRTILAEPATAVVAQAVQAATASPTIMAAKGLAPMVASVAAEGPPRVVRSM